KANDTRSTAISPPKCLHTSLATSSASLIAGFRSASDAPALDPRHDAGDTLRKREHRDDDESAHDQLPVLVDPGEPFLEQYVGKRPEHRADQRTHAAQDEHHQHGA